MTTPLKYTATQRKDGGQGNYNNNNNNGGLEFLGQHMNGTGDLRSRSNYLPGQGIVGKIGYIGGAGAFGRTFGQVSSVARVKKNLYVTARYKNLNKSGTLANRLNRALPANTNFPETSIREKMTSTGFETSTKFKLSHAE